MKKFSLISFLLAAGAGIAVVAWRMRSSKVQREATEAGIKPEAPYAQENKARRIKADSHRVGIVTTRMRRSA
jgi:hypothetical protein